MKEKRVRTKQAIAVALQYDKSGAEAPVVIASGCAETAKTMKSIARRYGVPVVTTERVANKLNDIRVNQQIPVELYEDVATILRNKGRF